MNISFLRLVSLCLCIGFTTSSFTFLTTQPSTNNDSLVFKIMEVGHLWELLDQFYEPNKDTDGTWLEVGLRSKYAMAKKYASLAILEDLTGEKVYLKGPHQEGFDFTAKDAFGYYNPAFLSAVEDHLKEALEQPAFHKLATILYNKHFYSLVETYQQAYLHAQNHPQQMQKIKLIYLEQISKPFGTEEGSMQETFRTYADQSVKQHNSDWYEAVTAPSFWVRRSIDQTDEQIFRILSFLKEELEAKG